MVAKQTNAQADKTLTDMAKEIHAIDRQFTKSRHDYIMQLGELLKKAQGLHVKVGCKGKFKKWIDEQVFSFQWRTAYNYMAYVTSVRSWTRPKAATVARFDVSALYELGGKDVEQAARDECLEKAESEEPVTRKVARRIIAEHAEANGTAKPKKTKTPPAIVTAEHATITVKYKGISKAEALQEAIDELQKALDALVEPLREAA